MKLVYILILLPCLFLIHVWHPRSPLNGINKYLTIITIVAAAAARMHSAVGTEFSRSSLFHIIKVGV